MDRSGTDALVITCQCFPYVFSWSHKKYCLIGSSDISPFDINAIDSTDNLNISEKTCNVRSWGVPWNSVYQNLFWAICTWCVVGRVGIIPIWSCCISLNHDKNKRMKSMTINEEAQLMLLCCYPDFPIDRFAHLSGNLKTSQLNLYHNMFSTGHTNFEAPRRTCCGSSCFLWTSPKLFQYPLPFWTLQMLRR